MKKLLVLTMCLVLAFSINALAAKGNPHDGLSEDIPVTAEIGPYASVMAQKTVFDKFFWFIGFWHEAEADMDFQHYTGRAGQRKFTDTNCFIVETNTSLYLEFTGTALQNVEHSDSKMLTTYWAFESHDPDELPLLIRPPIQIIPKYEIGYFGEAGHELIYDHPGEDSETEFVNIPEDAYLAILAGLAAGSGFYPTEGEVLANQTWHIGSNGVYAYQIFGFAGTDRISSQRAGDYKAAVTLTVSK